jgi:DNA-binding CsgD family transcriptional regulator
VCAGTLMGRTAEAIGADLGIAPSTVLTYRRRAYERCGISSAVQLLEGLLD